MLPTMEAIGMAKMPTEEEIDDTKKKLEMGFELTDREIWICKEILVR